MAENNEFDNFLEEDSQVNQSLIEGCDKEFENYIPQSTIAKKSEIDTYFENQNLNDLIVCRDCGNIPCLIPIDGYRIIKVCHEKVQLLHIEDILNKDKINKDITPIQEDKIKFKCKEGEQFNYYCYKCKLNLCNRCRSNHNHQNEIISFENE